MFINFRFLILNFLILLVTLEGCRGHGGIDDGHDDSSPAPTVNSTESAVNSTLTDTSGGYSPATAIGLNIFSGVSLFIGAVIPLLPVLLSKSSSSSSSPSTASATNRLSKKFLSSTMALSAGIMIFGTLTSLFPSSVSSIKKVYGDPGYFLALTYALIGRLIIYLIDLAIAWVSPPPPTSNNTVAAATDVATVETGNPANKDGEFVKLDGSAICPCHLEHDDQKPSCCTDGQSCIAIPNSTETEAAESGAVRGVTTLPTNSSDNASSDGAINSSKTAVPAWQTVIAIGLHKIPEGMATFLAATSNLKFGFVIGLAMLIHSVPEGMMAIVPVYYRLGSVFKSLLLVSAIAGTAPILGGLIAYGVYYQQGVGKTSSPVDKHLQGALYAIASGMLISISLCSMLPVAIQLDRKVAVLWLSLGITGIAIIFASFEFIH